jgi:hypothetical protein
MPRRPMPCSHASALLQCITSFQDGYPVVFAPMLRAYYAAGHWRRSPLDLQDYRDQPNHSHRLGDAVGFNGDTRAAETFFRLPGDAKSTCIVLRMHDMAIHGGHAALADWLRACLTATFNVTDNFDDGYFRLACLRGHVVLLEVLLERFGRERVERVVDAYRGAAYITWW